MQDLDVHRHSESTGEDPNSGFDSLFPDENLATHSSFRYPPTLPPSPPPAPVGTGSAPNSSIGGSEVGKNHRHKEKLKLAGLGGSDSNALKQSGDEVGESSPSQGPSGLGTDVEAEVGEEEDVEMAELSSPEPAPATKPAKYQKAPGEGTFMRTRSSVAVASSGPTRKQEW